MRYNPRSWATARSVAFSVPSALAHSARSIAFKCRNQTAMHRFSRTPALVLLTSRHSEIVGTRSAIGWHSPKPGLTTYISHCRTRTFESSHSHTIMNTSAPSASVTALPRGANLDAARDIFVSAFTESYTPLLGRAKGLPETPAALKRFLDDAFSSDADDLARDGSITTAYIASTDERIVGYLSVDVEREWIYLRQLAVCPKSKRCGVGRALVQRAMSDNSSVREIRVSFRACNSDAEKFYTSLGFAENAACHDTLDSSLYRGLVLQRTAKA